MVLMLVREMNLVLVREMTLMLAREMTLMLTREMTLMLVREMTPVLVREMTLLCMAPTFFCPSPTLGSWVYGSNVIANFYFAWPCRERYTISLLR